jgi:hypothetical protein
MRRKKDKTTVKRKKKTVVIRLEQVKKEYTHAFM